MPHHGRPDVEGVVANVQSASTGCGPAGETPFAYRHSKLRRRSEIPTGCGYGREASLGPAFGCSTKPAARVNTPVPSAITFTHRDGGVHRGRGSRLFHLGGDCHSSCSTVAAQYRSSRVPLCISGFRCAQSRAAASCLSAAPTSESGYWLLNIWPMSSPICVVSNCSAVVFGCST